MDELTFLGVDDSGANLLLRSEDGTQYRVAVTSALTAALHRRPERTTTEAPTAVTPREVQAMIRAGASAEQVADMSGWDLDKVARYEVPILAEREHVAALARGAYLPAFGRGPSPTLEKRAKERLVMRGLRPDDAWWDAWRPDGGPWTVSLSFEAGGRTRQAVWHFDALTSALTPQDDEARWLSTEEDDAFDDGSRGSSAPNGPSAGSPAGGHEPVSHATRTGAGHDRPLRAGDHLAEDSPEDGGPAEGTTGEQPVADSGSRDSSEGAPDGAAEPQGADEAPAEPAPEPPIAPRQRSSRGRKGRPSVPSWDDIMFGGSKG
ncbi:septation protein SepH [Kytococcus sp. Marseille-QA3725]